jgi:hypothetical protein
VNRSDKSKLESLISCDLDGQLSQDHQADLYRQVLRDPEARKLYDDQKVIDAAAGSAASALKQALNVGSQAGHWSALAQDDPDRLAEQLVSDSRVSRSLMAMSRIAAMLALCAGLSAVVWLVTRPIDHGTAPIRTAVDSHLANPNANSDTSTASVQDNEVAITTALSMPSAERQDIVNLHLGSQDDMPMFDESESGQWIVGDDFYGLLDEESGQFHWFPVQVAGSM